MLNLSRAELEQLLAQAAEEGARRALEKVGLHDDHAGDDVRDIRSLLNSYRVIKNTALKTAVQNVINLTFLAILTGLAVGWIKK